MDFIKPQGEGFTSDARVLRDPSEERGLSEEATTVVDASLFRAPMPTRFPLHRCHRCFSQSLSHRRLFPCSGPDTSKCPARPWSSFTSPPSRGHPILSDGESAKHGTIGSTNIKWCTRLCLVDLLLARFLSFLLEKR